MAASVNYFPQERCDSDGIDIVFDQEQTHSPDKGVELCMRMVRAITD
jgi:hypothetical protein